MASLVDRLLYCTWALYVKPTVTNMGFMMDGTFNFDGQISAVVRQTAGKDKNHSVKRSL